VPEQPDSLKPVVTAALVGPGKERLTRIHCDFVVDSLWGLARRVNRVRKRRWGKAMPNAWMIETSSPNCVPGRWFVGSTALCCDGQKRPAVNVM